MSERLKPERLISIAVRLTLIVLCLSGCVKRDHHGQSNGTSLRSNETRPTAASTTDALKLDSSRRPSTRRTNINTAPAEELEMLPGIGKALAQRIIEHRETYGPFRRPEHLIIVRGLSEKRFRALKDLITVD